MPPFPGEERLLTLFADVHYYFAQPAVRPLRHRFDKASYFYIYYNSTRQTSRIEIANNPGTPEQDAVHGYMDKCFISNSARFPSQLTIVVDANGQSASPTSPVSNRDPDEWRLESGDLRDASHQKHKVHTMDIYFWMQEDAKLAVDFCRKLLAPDQLDLPEQSQRSPTSKEHENVSPVVKNLENVAISDPAYQNGQTRNSQNQPQVIPVKLPPPPPKSNPRQSSPSVASYSISPPPQSTSRNSPATSHTATTDFTPMAYNPAAPAAPEPIAHREKTPPPADNEHGTGLAHAAARDDAYAPSQQYTGHTNSQISQGHWGSPPPPPPGAGSSWGSPPPPSVTPGYSHTSSLGYTSPPPQQPSQQSYHTSSSSVTPSLTSQPSSALTVHDPHRHSAAAEQYTPQHPDHSQPAETPGTEFYNTLPHDRKPLQHVQPRYQTEYFSPTGSPAYPLPDQSAGGNQNYNIHQQAYVPDANEQQAHSRHKHAKASKESSSSDASSFSRLKKFGMGLSSTGTKNVNKLLDKAERSKWA